LLRKLIHLLIVFFRFFLIYINRFFRAQVGANATSGA
jgi:hypothetical protein